MKKTRSRIQVLVIGTIFIIGILVIKNLIFQTNISKTNLVFPSLKKETINNIILYSDTTNIRLSKSNNVWQVSTSSGNFKADESRVTDLINGLSQLEKQEVVSVNRERRKELGIDQQKIEYQTPNQTITVFVGNSSGSDSNYLSINDENTVFIAPGFSNAYSPFDYRDLSPHLVDTEKAVNRLEITSASDSYTLEKKGENWTVGGKNVIRDRIDYYINDLKTLRASDIVTDQDFNLPTNPVIAIKIFENSKEINARFYTLDKDNYFLKVSDNLIYQIPSVFVTTLEKQEKDFIE